MYPDNKQAKISNSPADTLSSARTLLKAELNALHHELRRIKDRLEREGGFSQDLEKMARQLSENIQLCEADLEQHRHINVSDGS